jgi:hypothetical protein
MAAPRAADYRWGVAQQAQRSPGPSEDDAGRIVRTMTVATLCVDCLSRRTDIPKARVETLLAMVNRTVRVTSGVALCDACLNAKKVFQLG